MLLPMARGTAPTRNSEVQTFVQCRRKWYFNYQLQLASVRPSLTIVRGNIGHAALAALDRGQDWLVGATKYVDEFLATVPETEYQVDEEVILTLDSYHAEVRATLDEVIVQVGDYATNYQRWTKVHKVEEKHTVTIPGFATPINLTWDAIVEDNEGLHIIERKWVKQFRSEEMFDLDAQTALYQYAAQELGYKITSVIVDQIGPKPRTPSLNKPNKDGVQAMSRTKVGDWRTYRRALLAAGLDPSDYEDMRLALPVNSEFRRDSVYRNSAELERFLVEYSARVYELSTTRLVYGCDDRFRCAACGYRELCIAELKGEDTDHILRSRYAAREDAYAPKEQN